MLNKHISLAGMSAVVGLALLFAACTPATPTVVIGVTPATMAVTILPEETAAPPTATATEEEEPDVDEEVTEVVATGTAVVSELDTCQLVTDEEATAVLGVAPLSTTPGVDEDQGFILNFCTWLGSGQALVISVANTGDEATARAYIEAGSGDSTATLTKEGDLDLGPDVYWSTTEHAAGYYVAYGPHAFSVTIGGQVTVTDDLKAQLLKLAKAVGGRLGG